MSGSDLRDVAEGTVVKMSKEVPVDDDLLVLSESWPATTIDGEPGIVSGIMAVSRSPAGEFQLNLAVGPAGARPEKCDHVEFVLSAENARALREVLSP
jgi:hypothetical protein